MAITGKFVADFDDFYAAVTQAEVQLKSFETGSNKVEASLNRMADAFSGKKIIQEATLMVQAVEQIGGVTKLTAAEFARLQTTVTAATEKMQAIGIAVPTAMKEIAATTHEASEATGGLAGWVDRLGESMTASVAEGLLLTEVVHKLIEFGAEAVEHAAQFEHLSLATGISAESLQRLSYVTKAYGVDIDQVSRAVEQFSAKLAAPGPNSAKGAVEGLGLSVKTLLAAGPFEGFLDFADAVGRVEDPMLRASIAADVLSGRLAKALLPALRDLRHEIADVPEGAIISDADVKKAEEFETSLHHAVTWAEALVVKLASVATTPIGAPSRVDDTQIQQQLDAQQAATTKAAEGIHEYATAAGPAITAADYLANRLTALRAEALEPLTRQQRDNIIALHAYGVGVQEMSGLVEAGTPAITKFLEAQKAADEELKQFHVAQQEVASAGVDVGTTIQGITSDLQAYGIQLLRAGVSQKDLAIVFGLTATQVKALSTVIKEEQQALKTQDAQLTAFTRSALDYAKTVQAASHDTLATQIRDVELATAAKIAEMEHNKTLTETTRTLLEAARDQTIANLKQMFLEADATTKAHFDKLAEEAEIAYQKSITFAGQYTDAEKIRLQDAATTARKAAEDWGTATKQAAEQAAGAVDTVKTAFDTVATAATAAMGAINLVGPPTGVLSSNQFQQDFYKNFLPATARASGGPVAAGAPYVVGERSPELFVPSTSGTILPFEPRSGGSVVNINMQGVLLSSDPSGREAIRKVVDDALVSGLKRSRKLSF